MKSIARLVASPPRLRTRPGPIPVGMVITDLDVGGAERAFVALATGLDRNRWSPSVVCLDGEGELAAKIRDAGIPATCLNVDRRRPISAVARLASALRTIRPAIVQSFLFHANIAARLAAPFAGRPIVVGGSRVAERRANAHLRLDRLTQTLAAGSVCVSRGVMDFSVTTGGLDPARLVVIPNGVDPRPFDTAEPIPRADLGAGDDRPLGIFVGRLDLQKGVDDLLEAASIAQGFDLLVVGDGPERDRLRAKADALSTLHGRIHWLGRRRDVPRLLKTADFLVLPSLWEGMPNVVLEAMAAGLAVVGTSVEGTDELVEHGANGLLVPPRDPVRLAEALSAVARNPDLRRAMGAAGRAKVEAEYAPDRVVASYESLWSRLLGASFEQPRIVEAG